MAALGYGVTELPGVYRSDNIYVTHITLLVLNDLRDEPHNALVKAFASRKAEKAKAFGLLRRFWQLSSELLLMLEVLQTIWSLPEGATMNEILTPERVMEIGEEWKQIFLRNLSPEELDAYINPEYKRSLLTAGREEGREEGESALCKTIEQILQRRFEHVPTDVKLLLQHCTLIQLQELVNPALDTVDLDAFLAYIPRRAP